VGHPIRSYLAKINRDFLLTHPFHFALYLLYCLDLVTSDWYRFNYMKRQLSNVEFQLFEVLEVFVEKIVIEILPDRFRSVSENWIERFESIICHGGEFYQS
jgi:hypothetical protein